MKNKHEKDKESLNKQNATDAATENADLPESFGETEIDYSALSHEEAIEALKEVFDANKSLIAERDSAKEELEKEKEQSAKFKDNWYRTAAEFENFKKRNEFTRRNAYDDGIKDAVNALLSIGDSIDRALAVELDDKTREGVMLISRQFSESLAALKVEVIDPSGERFDPEKAEAIATCPAGSDEEDGLVKQVYKKGYTLGGKILRYAQVVVAAKQ